MNHEQHQERTMLADYRLSPAEFLIDAAVSHFHKTGKTVRGFIVPPAMWEELKSDPDVSPTRISYMLDVEGFDVIASNRKPPMLIEDGNPTGVPLL